VIRMSSPGLRCTAMWIACAKSRKTCVRRVEMLGTVLRSDAHNRAFTWEIAVLALCIKKRL
jgi:hypothetical protein